MIYLICLFIGIGAFFTTEYLAGLFIGMKFEGKIYAAITKDKLKAGKIKDHIMPTIFRLADNLGKHISKIRNNKIKSYIAEIAIVLKRSGKKYERFNAYQFIGLQVFSMIAGFIFSVVLISTNFLMILIIGLTAFLAPFLKLKEELKKRKNLMLKQLPDAADLLSVMLEAGIDFFSALDKVSEILKGPLSDEIAETSAKISLGYDRKTALSEMAAKCDVEQVIFFTKTVNMSLESGSGMADTLKRLAEQIRKESESIAEKKAQEAPVKILIPLILFIFPTIFIVIFGPIVINLMQTGSF
ncbi:MAG: type II secretion system F family protein [Elusimicrobiota bacterium]|jgi:tight adherence protein C|nr:type II secretion system F family protein [Elusimicrobiota bacterium]